MNSNIIKKVAAVVVTRNRKDLLLQCISALMGQTYKSMSIYIIDNASTDGTKKAIEDYINKGVVYYANTGSNIGGAGGFNYGMNIAAKSDCDYIWVMDDDTIPSNTSLEELIKAANAVQDNFGFLSSYAEYFDGTFCQMNRQLMEQEEWIEDYALIQKGILRIQRATFVSLLIKKETVFKEGLPFKEFFIWGDDTEYTYRLSSKYRCYFVANSKVLHKTKENVNTSMMTFAAETDPEKISRYYYNYRNWCYISWKYKHFRGALSELQRFVNVQYIVITKSKKYTLKKLGIVWRAYLSGLFFHPKVEYPTI